MVVLQDGVIVGAIWMGIKEGVSDISRIIKLKANISKWKEAILEDGFDFSVI